MEADGPWGWVQALPLTSCLEQVNQLLWVFVAWFDIAERFTQKQGDACSWLPWGEPPQGLLTLAHTEAPLGVLQPSRHLWAPDCRLEVEKGLSGSESPVARLSN